MPISTPSQITVPFATSGLKNAIPSASNPVTGNAGYDAGFPATNMTPKEAGGIPPFGQDFNGILFDITTAIRYLEAGMQFPYSSAFATAVGGYPLGALVSRTDGTGLWRNIATNNMTDPEAFGAGWQPENSGAAAITMAASNVTLSALEAARPTIYIVGTLTANVQLIFPTYQKQWLVANRASGSFSVTCKTASGGGVQIPTGTSQIVYGDGTGISAAYSVQTQQSAVGAFSNLKSSATGTSAAITITADEIVLEASAGSYLTVRGVNIAALSAAGSGANGLDTGTSAASTWYSIWVISNGTTTAGLLSLSSTAPTMPSGYTFKARIGWMRTDSSVNKYPLSYIQLGKSFRYKVAAGSNVTSLPSPISGVQGNTTTPTWLSVSMTPFAPVTASLWDMLVVAVTAGVTMLAPNNSYGNRTSTVNPPPLSAWLAGTTSLVQARGTITAEQLNTIYYAADSAGCGSFIIGWEDNL